MADQPLPERLVVTQPFEDFAAGEVIDDANTIKAVLADERRRFVVPVRPAERTEHAE